MRNTIFNLKKWRQFISVFILTSMLVFSQNSYASSNHYANAAWVTGIAAAVAATFTIATAIFSNDNDSNSSSGSDAGDASSAVGASEEWTEINNGLTNKNIYSLYSDDGYLYAGTDEGVFRSADYGDTWAESNSGIEYRDFRALSFSSDVSYLYVGTGVGVYRSDDNGGTWAEAGFQDRLKEVFSLNFFKNLLYGGAMVSGSSAPDMSSNGVFNTRNSGDDWDFVGLDNKFVHSMHPKDDYLYAGAIEVIGSSGGVFRTSNGADWVEVSSGISQKNITSLYSDASYLYAAVGKNMANQDGGVFRSSDGVNWTEVSNGVTNKDLRAVYAYGSYQYAGSDGGGILRSSNSGDLWSDFNTGLTNMSVQTIYSDGVYLYVGTKNGGVFRR